MISPVASASAVGSCRRTRRTARVRRLASGPVSPVRSQSHDCRAGRPVLGPGRCSIPSRRAADDLGVDPFLQCTELEQPRRLRRPRPQRPVLLPEAGQTLPDQVHGVGLVGYEHVFDASTSRLRLQDPIPAYARRRARPPDQRRDHRRRHGRAGPAPATSGCVTGGSSPSTRSTSLRAAPSTPTAWWRRPGSSTCTRTTTPR